MQVLGTVKLVWRMVTPPQGKQFTAATQVGRYWAMGYVSMKQLASKREDWPLGTLVADGNGGQLYGGEGGA